MKVVKSKVFVPVTDEMLYDRPELIKTPLRPYETNQPCFHWMATVENAQDGEVSRCLSHKNFGYDSYRQIISRLA